MLDSLGEGRRKVFEVRLMGKGYEQIGPVTTTDTGQTSGRE